MEKLKAFLIVSCAIVSTLTMVGNVEGDTKLFGEVNPTETFLYKGTLGSGTFPDGLLDRDDGKQLAYTNELWGGFFWIDVRFNFTLGHSRYPVYLNYEGGTQAGCTGNDKRVEFWHQTSISWIIIEDIPAWTDHFDPQTIYVGEPFVANSNLTIRFRLRCSNNDADFDLYHLWLDDSAYQSAKARIAIMNELNQTKTDLGELRKQKLQDSYGSHSNMPYVIKDITGAFEDTRGSEDVRIADPYLTMVYTANFTATRASSVSLWLPYDSTWSDVQVLSDRIDLSLSSSFTMFWVNDTDGNNLTDLYSINQTNPLNHFHAEGQNITIEVSGGDVRVDRYSKVKRIESFTWNWDWWTDLWYTTTSISNGLGMNMWDVYLYWAFPTEDEEDRPIWVDVNNIQVVDLDTSATLIRGLNYDASQSGISMGLEYILNSQTRQFDIRFEEKPLVADTVYREVHDYDITSSDNYPGSPWYTSFIVTQGYTTSFSGEVIIGFVFTQRFSNNVLAKSTVRVFVNGQHHTFSYDSRSNELHLYDVTFSRNTQNDIEIYFAFATAESNVAEFFRDYGVALFFAGLLMTGLSSGMWLDYRKGRKRISYTKKIGIWLAFIIGIVLIVLSGVVPLVL